MRYIEIAALQSGGHRNQTGGGCPAGWAVIPDDMELANFPFGEVLAEEIDGVMTVSQWIPGIIPEPDEEEKAAGQTVFFRRDIFLASTTFTAPISGWYRVTVIGKGGNGGKGSDYSGNYDGYGGGGGGGGGVAASLLYLTIGQALDIKITSNYAKVDGIQANSGSDGGDATSGSSGKSGSGGYGGSAIGGTLFNYTGRAGSGGGKTRTGAKGGGVGNGSAVFGWSYCTGGTAPAYPDVGSSSIGPGSAGGTGGAGLVPELRFPFGTDGAGKTGGYGGGGGNVSGEYSNGGISNQMQQQPGVGGFYGGAGGAFANTSIKYANGATGGGGGGLGAGGGGGGGGNSYGSGRGENGGYGGKAAVIVEYHC